MYTYLDIETFGNEPDISDVKVPKNYTNPETIKKYQEENLDKQWRENALDKFNLKIICCVISNPHLKIHEVITGEESEIIAKLEEIIPKVGNKPSFVTWNGNGFDLPILTYRALKYRAKRLYIALPKTKFSDRSVDLMEKFCFLNYKDRVSMANVLKYFDMGGKTEGLDGSKVHDAFLNGEIERIAKYCEGDVNSLIALHKLLLFDDNSRPF